MVLTSRPMRQPRVEGVVIPSRRIEGNTEMEEPTFRGSWNPVPGL